MTKAEHRHLTELTQNADRRAFVRETVPPAVRRTVEQLNLPAYVTGRRWDILAWNAAAEEIFAFSRLAEADRNSLLSVLTNPATRRLFGASWTDEARRIVAQFRATHDLWAGDPAFRDLLARLREGCPEFAGWWEAHDISGVAAGRKSLSHPKKGRLKLEYASFQANDDPALKLVIYTDGLSPRSRYFRHLSAGRFPGTSPAVCPFSLDFYLALEPKLDRTRRKEKMGSICRGLSSCTMDRCVAQRSGGQYTTFGLYVTPS